MKAEELLTSVESYIETGAWHSGTRFKVTSHLVDIRNILSAVEKAPPSVFVELYLEYDTKAAQLYERWLKANNSLPPNPWLILSSGKLPDWSPEES
jgi:hypothetical protein